MQLGFSIGLNGYHVPNQYIPDNGGQPIDYEVRVNPGFTTLAGISWSGWLVPQDNDKDGIMNARDACPERPEDKDGFKDQDGCPEEDNDEDGIPDKVDACPNKPEDVDGFQDDDGCIDADNDQDGIPDAKDGCPMLTEDIDGNEDADGCPEHDNDKDGVPDSTDKCPMVAEDMDSFEDQDGCPDIDNDKDGIVDVKDKCPNKPENVNGFEDEDGCPDEKKKVEVKKIEKKVTLRGVNFKTGSADLTFESHQILNGVVEQLLAYPEVEIEIRGHTDNVGSNRSNQRLSERRAQSVVDYLGGKGVARNRMKATGYGENQPVAPNKTADGRRQNRRIEMYRTK
jgi:outer membrane protein OmpA-like peptidoglycan-associated protein